MAEVTPVLAGPPRRFIRSLVGATRSAIESVRSLIPPATARKGPEVSGPRTVSDRPDLPRELRGLDRFVLPHQRTFGSADRTFANTYRVWRDEAQRNSLEDALAMRRDGFIHELLRHRQYPSSELPFHLEPDDPKDAYQMEVCRDLTKVIEATPRFQDLRLWLLEAAWFGRSASQVAYRRRRVGLNRRVCVGLHRPVQGDKVVYKFDGTPGVLIHGTWRPAPDEESRAELDSNFTDRGKALFLHDPYFRDRFVIHEFEPTDVDYLFETDKAGAVHGLGLRDRIYWAWYMRSELLSYAIDGLQVLKTDGRLVVYYNSGNPKSRDQMLEAARVLGRDGIVLIGRETAGDGAPEGFEHIPTGSESAFGTLLNFIEYFDGIIRRAVIGQELTSKSEPLGIGGGAADVQQDTFNHIVKYDCNALAETLTKDLVEPLARMNYGELPFGIRMKIVNKIGDVGPRMVAAKALTDIGAQLDLQDLIEEAGFTPAVAAAPGPAGGASHPPAGGNGSAEGNGHGGAVKLAAGWDESVHPRDDSGKWTDGPAGGSAATGPPPRPTSRDDLIGLKAHLKARLRAGHRPFVVYPRPRAVWDYYRIEGGRLEKGWVRVEWNPDFDEDDPGDDKRFYVEASNVSGSITVHETDDLGDARRHAEALAHLWAAESADEPASRDEGRRPEQFAEFREADHPRDADGRWAGKYSVPAGLSAKAQRHLDRARADLTDEHRGKLSARILRKLQPSPAAAARGKWAGRSRMDLLHDILGDYPRSFLDWDGGEAGQRKDIEELLTESGEERRYARGLAVVEAAHRLLDEMTADGRLERYTDWQGVEKVRVPAAAARSEALP